MDELKVVRERREEYGQLTQFRSSVDIYTTFRERFERTDREEFLVLLLDGKNKLLGFNVVSIGTLTSSLTHPREVFKAAILGNAASIILLHNHPSGDPIPSAEDIAITRQLKEVGEVHGIRVLDHVIIGAGRYVSFVDDGYWPS
jgi:DNA repair protein RadC